jgi:hypothetical protein
MVVGVMAVPVPLAVVRDFMEMGNLELVAEKPNPS